MVFAKDTVIGFLLLSQTEIIFERNKTHTIGYRIKPSIKIRHKELEFLKLIQRSIQTNFQVKSSLLEKESKYRDKPILKIYGIKECAKIVEALSKNSEYIYPSKWIDFIVIIRMMIEKKHLTLEGFEKIAKIKGLIQWD